MADTDGGLTAATERKIERFLDDRLVEENIPGCSVAVFDAEGVLYSTGLGARDLESNAPATPDTIYNAGSVTKIATAIAVLQLVDRTALALDDAVADHVPFLADAPGDPITVGELLSHTSGVPNVSIELRDNIATQRDFQRHLDGGAANRVTEDPPHLYNNACYRVLGELVETVDSRTYADYVEDEILTPLGMDRSTFDVNVFWDADDAMTPYRQEGDELVPTEDHDDWKIEGFGTPPAEIGLNSPVTELPHLLRCLLHDGTVDGTTVLASESVAAMTTMHSQTGSSVDGEALGYGYGLGVESFLGETLVDHSGGGADSQAYVGALTDRGLGVALAINTEGGPIGDYGRAVLALAAGESPEEQVWRFALREKLDAVAGSYEAYRGPSATVEVSGGHLTVEIKGERGDYEFPAFPASLAGDDYSFYTVAKSGVRSPLEFRKTDTGWAMLWTRYRYEGT